MGRKLLCTHDVAIVGVNSQGKCRLCRALHTRKYYEANKESVKHYNKLYYQAKMRDTPEYFQQRSRTMHQRYSSAKTGAKKRRLPFTLSKESFSILIRLPCHYCQKVTFKQECGGGLDRINNALGYTWDNILPCCGDCNRARGNRYTIEEFKVMIEALLKYRTRHQVNHGANE